MEGRIIKHFKEYEQVPDVDHPIYGTPGSENPLLRLEGSLRVKAGTECDVDMNYDGWLEFRYWRPLDKPATPQSETPGEDAKEWLAYRAKFFDGKLVEVSRLH